MKGNLIKAKKKHSNLGGLSDDVLLDCIGIVTYDY